ncbi:MAG: peptidoglycan DD-metalloendopeptidase family protein [Anaerolineae bacterium]|nr:peptidoglycan DD-metalloendopeptidase family protein [Anaerolineae bacterium]MDW8172669.1 peptidoglycan DD-metalloendopeptidase family protein [Anaerolineae bacterium]
MRRLLIALIVLWSAPAQAQRPCAPVDGLRFPFDDHFQLVQDFAVPSLRHQGRYHTGEDWYGGGAGQVVYAMANGQVTFSGDRAWGMDGGVVIIAHDMPDGARVFSMVGHVQSSPELPLPARLSCVEMGQPLGLIVDARPAPHVHWEIRTQGQDTPGAGYERAEPRSLGLIDPSDFVLNGQARLHSAAAWFSDVLVGGLRAALVLNDGSFLALDEASHLRRFLPDGRVLWRTRLSATAVDLFAMQGASYLVNASGLVQRIDVASGRVAEAWRIGGLEGRSLVQSAPSLGNLRLYHDGADGLLALSADARALVWRLDDVPPFITSGVGLYDVGAVLGGATADGRLIVIEEGGVRLGEARIENGAAFGVGPGGGGLWAYTRDGLWRIGPSSGSLWTPQESPPAPNSARAFYHDGALRLLYNGQGGALNDQPFADLPAEGLTRVIRAGDLLILASSGGQVSSLNARTGQICQRLRLAADRRLRLPWLDVHGETLRLAIGPSLMGLRLARLGC